MPAIIGPVTPGRIAFVLGTLGVGAAVGGVIADQRDADVGKGALYGGLAAAAGLSLLYGGAYAWNRFSAGSAGAAGGASQLGSQLTRFTTPAPQAAAVPGATQAWAHLPSPASLFRTTPRLTVPVPSIAATPALPFALPSSGTFIDTLRTFVR